MLWIELDEGWRKDAVKGIEGVLSLIHENATITEAAEIMKAYRQSNPVTASQAPIRAHRSAHRVVSVHPRSLKNLRPPFQPGQSGNPKGRPSGKTQTERFLQAIRRGDAKAANRLLLSLCKPYHLTAMVISPEQNTPSPSNPS